MKLDDALQRVTHGSAAFRCPKGKPFHCGTYLVGDELMTVRRDGSLVIDAHTPYATFHSDNDDWEVLPFER